MSLISMFVFLGLGHKKDVSKILIAILKASPNAYIHAKQEKPTPVWCKHFPLTAMDISVKLAIFQNTSSKKQTLLLICRIIYFISLAEFELLISATKLLLFHQIALLSDIK